MQPLQRALSVVKFSIPRAVLAYTFQEFNNGWRQNPASLDEQMLLQCIRPRILVDCDLVGGIEVFISLSGLPYETFNDYIFVYHIPKERTMGRSILSPLSVGYVENVTSMINSGLNYSPIRQDSVIAATAVLNSFSSFPILSTAELQLIGENTVMIRNQSNIVNMNILRCVMSNSEDLNDLQLRSIPAFTQLCVLGVKSYIYNKVIVELNKGELSGGQELGVFKEIISTYADAEAQYQDYLINVWQKVTFMNDPIAQQRLIKLMMGPYK
jgi:hypothetical protein